MSSQGEDVSMGIWMAAIGPKRYQVSLKELSDLTERVHASVPSSIKQEKRSFSLKRN